MPGFDYNGNGSWADAGEKIFTSYPLNAGTSLLTTLVPSTATVGLQTYARFRFTTNKSIISYDGELADGEVEDYMVVIEDFEPGYDLGDAPDSTNNFGTTMTAYPVGTPGELPQYLHWFRPVTLWPAAFGVDGNFGPAG